MIDVRYDFRTLEVGDSNKNAISICKDICEWPHSYSGLWMFGPSGCGKTHLLKAIYNVLNYREDRMKGLYISAKELAELLYDFLGKGSNLWVHIKNYDYLLIDNAEDLLGRPKTQEMIAELITEMCANNKLVFLTSVCPPCKLRNLDGVLQSHKSSIPIVEIQSPDYNLKKSIVENYIFKNSINISDEACELLITTSNHIPRLKGVLFSAKHLFETQGICIEKEWIKRYVSWV